MIQNPMISGKKLPTLTNPAGAANIQTGYEAIDGNGDLITGTHDCEAGQTPICGTVQRAEDDGYLTISLENANKYSHLLVIALKLTSTMLDTYVQYGIYPCIFYSTDEVISPNKQFYNASCLNKVSNDVIVEPFTGYSAIGSTPRFLSDKIEVFTPDVKPLLPGTYFYIVW